MEEIIQIMPAEGWRGLWVGESPEDMAELLVEPLVGWALMKNEEGFTSVVGLSAYDTVTPCHEDYNFVLYIAPGKDPENYREEARRKLRSIQRKS
jgi:hypothetical protein